MKTSEFWLQAHNLPPGFFTEKIAQAIGDSLGTHIRADKKNFEESWKTFMRIRVLFDITKPLRRKMKMKKQGSEWFWVKFKYERLPNFFFLCGIIGHRERFCHLLFEGANEETERPYGSWLRATGRRPPMSSGNQWLLPNGPPRPASNLTSTQEVEMTEVGAHTQYMYENQSILCTEGDNGQISRNLEVCEKDKGKEKSTSVEAKENLGFEAH